MDNATVTSVMSLISRVVIFGGAVMIVFGAIVVGTNLKDHNGPGIANGIWTIAGGALIVLAGALFTGLVI